MITKFNRRLASVVLDAQIGTKQVIYTVPPTKRFILFGYILRDANTNFSAITGSVTFGFNASANDLPAATLAGLTDGNKALITQVETTVRPIAVAGDVLGCIVADTTIPALNAVVTAAGTAAYNGSYTARGTSGGKPYYNLVGKANDATKFSIRWSTGKWAFTDGAGVLIYSSTDAVAYPWLVTTWVDEDSPNNEPVPVVAAGVHPKVTVDIFGYTY